MRGKESSGSHHNTNPKHNTKHTNTTTNANTQTPHPHVTRHTSHTTHATPTHACELLEHTASKRKAALEPARHLRHTHYTGRVAGAVHQRQARVRVVNAAQRLRPAVRNAERRVIQTQRPAKRQLVCEAADNGTRGEGCVYCLARCSSGSRLFGSSEPASSYAQTHSTAQHSTAQHTSK